MLREEKLERMQLLWHTLDVIEAVNADNNLNALKAAFERLNALLNVRLVEVLLKIHSVRKRHFIREKNMHVPP
jgi:hypothetical protein